MKKFLWSLFGVGALLVSAQVAYTASDSQQFTVNVPQRITIDALGAANVTATLPDSSLPLSFPAQGWDVKGNVRPGVGVTFKTLQAFTNTTDTNFKRDARLTLGLTSNSGPATWTLGTTTDTTNYASGDGEALVGATSNNVGRATFSVGVEFLTVNIAEVLEGDYVTVVEGTVTSN
jgi:hypothetical protein